MDNPLAPDIPQPISALTEQVLILERHFPTGGGQLSHITRLY